MNESNLTNSNLNRPRPTIIDCDSPATNNSMSGSPREQFVTPPSLTPPSPPPSFLHQTTSSSLDLSGRPPHLVHPSSRAASSVALGSKYSAIASSNHNSRSSPSVDYSAARMEPGMSSSTFASWSATSAGTPSRGAESLSNSPFRAGTPWSASTATSGGITSLHGDDSAMSSYVQTTPVRSEAQERKERAPWNTDSASVSPGQSSHPMHGSNHSPSPGSNNSGSHSGNRLDNYNSAISHHRGMVAVSGANTSPESNGGGLLDRPGSQPGAPPPPPEVANLQQRGGRTGLPRASPNVVGTHVIEDEFGVPVEELRLWTGVKLRKPDGRNLPGKRIVIQAPTHAQRQQRKFNPHKKQLNSSAPSSVKSSGPGSQGQGHHPPGVKKHSPKAFNPATGNIGSDATVGTPSTGSSGMRSSASSGKQLSPALTSPAILQNGNNHSTQ